MSEDLLLLFGRGIYGSSGTYFYDMFIGVERDVRQRPAERLFNDNYFSRVGDSYFSIVEW